MNRLNADAVEFPRAARCWWSACLLGSLSLALASGMAIADDAAAQKNDSAAPAADHAAPANDGAASAGQLDWATLETPMLTHAVQLTSPERFLRAGEAYFESSGRWVIFQAIEVPEEGKEPDQHYAMYVAKFKLDGQRNIAGIEEPIRISPPGSANTCGWFHPRLPWQVIYGSTLVPPKVEGSPGYQRGTGRYMWQFPNEMNVVQQSVQEIFDDVNRDMRARMNLPADALQPQVIIEHPGYVAECAYDLNGLHMVFCAVDPESGDGDLYAFNTRTRVVTPLVTNDGYDGGPFFSPDGRRICYRSDRRGDNLLQLFVADLAFDAAGNISGIVREHQLTNNQHVNWAPFWHPSGKFLIYATSEAGHDNYEVFAIPVPPASAVAPGSVAPMAEPIRVTHASGFDGLPVFSKDGSLMMWTSQRGGPWDSASGRPSSQLWIAKFQPDATLQRLIDGSSGKGIPLDTFSPTKP